MSYEKGLKIATTIKEVYIQTLRSHGTIINRTGVLTIHRMVGYGGQEE